MDRPNACEARQQSDQMRCERCDLTWDMNDHEPPPCPLMQGPGTVDRLVEARKRIAEGARMVEVAAMDIFNAGREFERALIATDKGD